MSKTIQIQLNKIFYDSRLFHTAAYFIKKQFACAIQYKNQNTCINN